MDGETINIRHPCTLPGKDYPNKAEEGRSMHTSSPGHNPIHSPTCRIIRSIFGFIRMTRALALSGSSPPAGSLTYAYQQQQRHGHEVSE